MESYVLLLFDEINSLTPTFFRSLCFFHSPYCRARLSLYYIFLFFSVCFCFSYRERRTDNNNKLVNVECRVNGKFSFFIPFIAQFFSAFVFCYCNQFPRIMGYTSSLPHTSHTQPAIDIGEFFNFFCSTLAQFTLTRKIPICSHANVSGRILWTLTLKMKNCNIR